MSKPKDTYDEAAHLSALETWEQAREATQEAREGVSEAREQLREAESRFNNLYDAERRAWLAVRNREWGQLISTKGTVLSTLAHPTENLKGFKTKI